MGSLSSTSRLTSIDTLKGFLIVLVMIGHITLGGVERSLVRYVIYSFHMPLFIGISGYLFDFDRSVPSVVGIIRKYGIRLIVPWIIAMCGYVLILRLDPTYLVIPYYHLWYIPAFVGWVALTLFLKWIGAGRSAVFVVAACISLVVYQLKAHPDLLGAPGFAKHATEKIIHALRPQFYIFFAFGTLLRSKTLRSPNVVEYILVCAAFAMTMFLFTHPLRILAMATFFFFNLSLIDVGLKLSTVYPRFNVRWLEWIGTNSLGIYLWHALPILLAQKMIGTGDVPLYYLVCIVSSAALLFGYMFLSQYAFLRKFFFGLGSA